MVGEESIVAGIVLSGCSGGGKSSLLTELGRRGHTVVPEAGRQVVREQMLIGVDDALQR